MTRMPTEYKGPLGVPSYWRNGVSGELHKAVHAYLNHMVDGEPLTQAQLELVRNYLEHWIGAPCWDMSPATDEDSPTLWQTMAEAQPAAKAVEAANRASAA